MSKEQTYNDDEQLQDILMLVSVEVPLQIINSWSVEDRKAAIDWAGAVHFAASDNDNEIPPCPEILKPFGGRDYKNTPLVNITSLMAWLRLLHGNWKSTKEFKETPAAYLADLKARGKLKKKRKRVQRCVVINVQPAGDQNDQTKK